MSPKYQIRCPECGNVRKTDKHPRIKRMTGMGSENPSAYCHDCDRACGVTKLT